MPRTATAFSAGTAREVVLQSAPSLVSSYARAAIPVSGRPRTLPEVVLRMRDVVPDASHVAAYCGVVGHPFGETLPVLYPHMLSFGMQLRIMSGRDFPFPAMGLVHTTNEVVQARPIALGEPLDVSVHAGSLRPHAKGRTVDLVTVVSVAGVEVWTETSTYLALGKASAEPASEPPRGTADPEGVAEPPDFHRSARWRLRADLGRRYGAVSGDRNPIHLAAFSARAFGFPRAIAHGMWTAAAMAGAVAARLPGAFTYSTEFRRPVLLPSTVWLHTAVQDDGVHLEVRRDTDDAVLVQAQAVPSA